MEKAYRSIQKTQEQKARKLRMVRDQQERTEEKMWKGIRRIVGVDGTNALYQGGFKGRVGDVVWRDMVDLKGQSIRLFANIKTGEVKAESRHK